MGFFRWNQILNEGPFPSHKRGQSYPFWVPYDYHSIRIHIFGTNNIGCKALIFEQDPQRGKKVDVSPIYSVRKIGREEGLMHATNNPVGVMRSGLRSVGLPK